MFIGIGLGIFAVTLITIGAFTSLTIVDQGYFVFVKWLGGEVSRVLAPGVHWRWPFWLDQIEQIKMERYTHDIKEVLVTCNVKGLDGLAGKDVGGVAEFKSEKVSLNFELKFKLDDNAPYDMALVENYIRYRQTSRGSEDKLAKLIEEVTDIIQAQFREKALAMEDYTAVMKFPGNEVKTILAETQKLCDERKIPINIVNLKLNNPFKPVDGELAKSLEQIAQESFLQRAADIEYAKKVKIAEREKEIKIITAEGEGAAMKIKAEKQAESIQIIAKAMGVEKLPDKDQAGFYLSKNALDVYSAMFANPSAKFVISGNIMAEIQSMLSKFKGG
jgi:regulator of protease activity HflC (stomatin/prohibitin superfamily)